MCLDELRIFQQVKKKTMSFRKKYQCPLDNNCHTTSVIYKANVTTDKDDTGKNYIELTEGTFNNDIRNINYHSATENTPAAPN